MTANMEAHKVARFDDEETSFARRSLLLGGFQLLLGGVILGRLQYLQLSQSEAYTTLAEANRVKISPIIAPRGRIIDRYGQWLAENDRTLSLSIVREQVPDLPATLRELQRVLGWSDEKLARVRNAILRQPRFRETLIAKDLSWEDFAKVNLELPFLAGVEPKLGEKRVYNHPQAVAHIVGYVGPKTRRDIEEFGNLVTNTVGQTGIERDYENQLRGEAGVRHLEVNANGRTVRELSAEGGEAGEDVRLTIDADLQAVATKRLGQRSGSVVVMDVRTGDIMCMVSAPSFDPNQFASGIDMKSWRQMLTHERKPLLNKAVQGLYAPGSTFKMIVALAALEAGIIDPKTKVNCKGDYEYGNEKYHCWLEEGHGDIDLEGALAGSCDVYFYDLALKIGIDKIEEMAARFGLGMQTGLDLSGEKTGTVPGRDWKRARYNTGWRGGETVITGIGQGFLLATPLQLTVMTAALANKGVLVRPRLLAGPDEEVERTSLDLNAKNMAIIESALYRAVNRPEGTAYGSSLLIKNQRMSGKTGTVQVRRISTEERETGVIANKDLDWRLRDHALFVGYAPHKNPRYAISVVIEHGGGGAQVAAPIARDVMVHLLENEPAAASAPPVNADIGEIL
jgi:penicillin-binding protein 2